MIGSPVVAFNTYAVNSDLRTFKNPHFQVDGISGYIDFYRINVEEKIAIILVQGTHVITLLWVVVEALV